MRRTIAFTVLQARKKCARDEKKCCPEHIHPIRERIHPIPEQIHVIGRRKHVLGERIQPTGEMLNPITVQKQMFAERNHVSGGRIQQKSETGEPWLDFTNLCTLRKRSASRPKSCLGDCESVIVMTAVAHPVRILSEQMVEMSALGFRQPFR